MLRRIFIGAAIASTVFAGSSAAFADYTKPEKDDHRRCDRTNTAAAGILGGILLPILNDNQINILALGNEINHCTND
ncbi:hypothetical protein GCM10010404_05060 [Nonomuraea africana]